MSSPFVRDVDTGAAFARELSLVPCPRFMPCLASEGFQSTLEVPTEPESPPHTPALKGEARPGQLVWLPAMGLGMQDIERSPGASGCSSAVDRAHTINEAMDVLGEPRPTQQPRCCSVM